VHEEEEEEEEEEVNRNGKDEKKKNTLMRELVCYEVWMHVLHDFLRVLLPC